MPPPWPKRRDSEGRRRAVRWQRGLSWQIGGLLAGKVEDRAIERKVKELMQYAS